MIPFVVIAAAMIAIALACVLVPLLRHAKPAGIAREASNVEILRDQLSELDADLASGAMPRERYEEARRELEQRVLEDSKAGAVGSAPPTQSAAWTAAILAGTIPVVALVLYVSLGSIDAFSPGAMRVANNAGEGTEHEITREQIAAGKSDKEIVDYMVARYGDFVLYQPPVKTTTLLLWAGPALLVGIGFLVLARTVRLRRARPAEPALTADERERVARLLGDSAKDAR